MNVNCELIVRARRWFVTPAGTFRRAKSVLALASGLVAIAICAGPVRAEWQTFTTSDGLGHNQVDAVLEAADGKLYFGTRGGLTCYDGLRWKTYTIEDGMSDSRVSFLLEDSQGDIWCASDWTVETPRGLNRFDGTCWISFTEEDGLSSDEITGMFESQDGCLWFATDNGVSRYDGETWTTSLHVGGVDLMLEDSSGNLWFSRTGSRLHRFDGTDWTDLGYVGDVRDIFEDHAGRIWIATYGSGVGYTEGDQFTMYTTLDGLADDLTVAIEECPDGVMWFGTSRGLSRFDGGNWTTFLGSGGVGRLFVDTAGALWFEWGATAGRVVRFDGSRWVSFGTDDGLADLWIRAIVEDSAGNMWFGTDRGVSRFDKETWETVRTEDGLAGECVSSILRDRAGDFWFGTDGGVSRFDGETWMSYTESDGLGDDNVSCVFEDSDGRIWAGTYSAGVSCFDDSTWTVYGTADGLPYHWVSSVAEDREGNLWFATSRGDVGVGYGVARFDGENWTVITSDDGLVEDNVFWIYADQEGDLWFATRGGVSHYDGEAWTSYTTDDGLVSPWVTHICQDGSGDFWFTTYYGGVSQFDGSVWTSYTVADGLASDTVFSCSRDDSGNVWFGTESGASRFDGVEWMTLTAADGLADNFVLPIYQDDSGVFWFGTYGGGLSIYEPDRVSPRTVFLGQLQSLLGSRQVDFGFVAAFNETPVEFSYSLDGASWSSWSAINSHSVSGLVDGAHGFRVRARDRVHNVEPSPATWMFEVDATPPTPVIAHPAFGAAVRDSIDVLGTADDARFAEYVLDVRIVGSSSWEVLEGSGTPVTEGTLGRWNTKLLADGDYELRLSASDTLGLTGIGLIRVEVDNEPPWAWETSPVAVSASTGGDVYTTNREVHLYFPPRAFARDALVSVVQAEEGSVPDSLAGGAELVLAGYDISWEGAELTKQATLGMTLGERAGARDPDGVPALYVLAEGQDWQRVGGTVAADGSSIYAAIDEEGTYAVYTDSGVGTGGGLSVLSFTPRVFSPSGSFANTEVAIGFTLGRSGPVTVKVYNRAGRLVDELVSRLQMNAGANIVTWDGRDGDAAEVPDGLYLVTVEALGETQVQTLAVVR